MTNYNTIKIKEFLNTKMIPKLVWQAKSAG